MTLTALQNVDTARVIRVGGALATRLLATDDWVATNDPGSPPEIQYATDTALTDGLALRAPLASPTGTGVASWPVLTSSGLTGATAASRYVGATTSGAPASGSFLKGDWVIDQTGIVWVCTTAGTPGTWVDASSSGKELAYASSSAVQTGIAATPTDITGLSITFTVGARPVIVEAWLPYLLSVTAAVTWTSQITDSGGTKKQGVSGQMTAATQWGFARIVERFPAGTGAITRKVQVLRALGSGTITVNADATTTASISAIER